MHFNKTRIATAIFATLVSSTALADIKIAVIAPMSGGSQSMGAATRDGAALAVAEINSTGGILGGKKIQLVNFDDKGRADLGEQLSKEAVEKTKVAAAVGFASTNSAIRALPVFQKSGIPLVLSAATGTNLTQTYRDMSANYIFRTSAFDMIEADAVANIAVKVRNMNRVAVFADSTQYGEQGLLQLMVSLDKHGVRPVMVERFPLGKTDFEDAAIKARQLNADAIVTWTSAPENVAIKTSFNRIGSRIPLIGSSSVAQKIYSDVTGPIAGGSSAPITFSADTERPVGQKFINNYRNLHSVAAIPSDMAAAQAYDAVYLLAKAINQAKSVDGRKVVEALENLEGSFDGAVMTYEKPFSKDNHDTIKSSSQLQAGIVRNGTVVRLK